jgi:RNA polymerase sigma-70 factor (ECF subfamily)
MGGPAAGTVRHEGLAMTEAPQERFMTLLERHQKIVFKVASLYAGNAEDRRDLVQEITIQLWRSFSGYDERRTFSTWMYRVSLNVAISFGRKAGLRAKYSAALDEETRDPIDHTSVFERDDRIRVLRGIIAGLDPMNRALLLLYLEEHSYREIGEVLGLSETNVATKISRLKMRIRHDIEAQP